MNTEQNPQDDLQSESAGMIRHYLESIPDSVQTGIVRWAYTSIAGIGFASRRMGGVDGGDQWILKLFVLLSALALTFAGVQAMWIGVVYSFEGNRLYRPILYRISGIGIILVAIALGSAAFAPRSRMNSQGGVHRTFTRDWKSQSNQRAPMSRSSDISRLREQRTAEEQERMRAELQTHQEKLRAELRAKYGTQPRPQLRAPPGMTPKPQPVPQPTIPVKPTRPQNPGPYFDLGDRLPQPLDDPE